MSRGVSSLDRFSDPLTPMGYSGPPTNLPILLSRLGVKGQPVAVQRAAVEEWLEHNEPIGLLKLQVLRLDSLLS